LQLVNRAARTVSILLVAASALLAFAPSALAADGVGIWGRTDDKVVTFFAFGVMAFFVIFVITLSLIQIRLENRKERAREELERLRRP
jgi:peptidoglycan/LPS O-acetylase OafA/YrhL